MNNSVLYNYSPQELQRLLDESNGYCDVLKKSGLSPHGNNNRTLKKLICEYSLSTTEMDKNRKERIQRTRKIPLDEIIIDNIHPGYKSAILLKRIVKETVIPYQCNICGISEWNGKALSLQLHHIDCNHENNHISNLQILCPNCHSQIHSEISIKREKQKRMIKEEKKRLRKRNYKNLYPPPPVERNTLKTDIRTLPMVKVGKKYGVSDNAIRKWCKRYNLPYHSRIIKRMTDEEWENV